MLRVSSFSLIRSFLNYDDQIKKSDLTLKAKSDRVFSFALRDAVQRCGRSRDRRRQEALTADFPFAKQTVLHLGRVGNFHVEQVYGNDCVEKHRVVCESST